jgi:SAM-dependent methyltransferase
LSQIATAIFTRYLRINPLGVMMSARFHELISDLDLSRPGVEYGALDRPLIQKDKWPVLYVDYADTETVRAKAYREDGDGTVKPENIQPIDLIWGERPLKEHGLFHYAVASHVIEHVPDVIGWLKEITEALEPGGVIALAVPDKRYTFDIGRPESTTGEMVQSWLEKRTRPTIRQVFDNCRMAIDLPCHEIWEGKTNGPLMMGESGLQFAYTQCLEQMNNSKYIDSHCWIFTPNSFINAFEDLFKLGILPLEIEKFRPTTRGQLEFYVRLRLAGSDPLATFKDARQAIVETDALNMFRPRTGRPHRFAFVSWLKERLQQLGKR